MALTAATPIVKGRLAASDVRWSLISQSVDDRTPAERGEASASPDARMAGGGVRRQSKSRYDSISCDLDQVFLVGRGWILWYFLVWQLLLNQLWGRDLTLCMNQWIVHCLPAGGLV